MAQEKSIQRKNPASKHNYASSCRLARFLARALLCPESAEDWRSPTRFANSARPKSEGLGVRQSSAAFATMRAHQTTNVFKRKAGSTAANNCRSFMIVRKSCPRSYSAMCFDSLPPAAWNASRRCEIYPLIVLNSLRIERSNRR